MYITLLGIDVALYVYTHPHLNTITKVYLEYNNIELTLYYYYYSCKCTVDNSYNTSELHWNIYRPVECCLSMIPHHCPPRVSLPCQTRALQLSSRLSMRASLEFPLPSQRPLVSPLVFHRGLGLGQMLHGLRELPEVRCS